MYGMGRDNVVKLVRRGLAAQKKASSHLYFVECTTELIEGATLPGPTTGFGAREVTLIHMSFTNIDVLIALPSGGVTFVGPW